MTSKKTILLLYSYTTYPNGERRFMGHDAILNDNNTHKDITYIQSSLSDLVFYYDGDTLTITEPLTNRDLVEFDDVIFCKWTMLSEHAFAAAVYLQAHGRPFISREVANQNPISKLGEMAKLTTAHLPYPKSMLTSSSQFLDKRRQLPFKLPFILKDIFASQGSNNYLIHNRTQFASILKAQPMNIFMAQEYIENDGDYRICILGGKVAYVIKRSRNVTQTHLNNTSQGSSAKFIKVTSLQSSWLNTATDAAKILGRQDFAGIDLITSKDGKYYILEVNKTPEIQTGFDPVTKSSIFTDYIYQRMISQPNNPR